MAKQISDLEAKSARREKALLDWPNLARYRDANAQAPLSSPFTTAAHRADGSTITMTDRRQTEKILALNQWIKTYCADHDDLYLDIFPLWLTTKAS